MTSKWNSDDKRTKASFVHGKLTAKENIQISIDTTIKQLEPEELYTVYTRVLHYFTLNAIH